MSEVHEQDVPAQAGPAAVSLPCPLPSRYPTEPKGLTEYRRSPGDEKQFMKLRRSFRESEDWRALASLLALHAAAIQGESKTVAKAAELCIQAYELWLERVKDRESAAHALARAVLLRPENSRAQERLRKLYETVGAHKELVALLRWRLRTTPDAADAAALHLELAELLEQNFLAVGESVQHYEQALELNPGVAGAADRLIELYLRAGGWGKAGALIVRVLESLDPGRDRLRLAELHRVLAMIESEQHQNVAAAARHLQAALKVVPDDIEALRAFGVLYLSSGKATDDGVEKAADIFYKAAELARRRGDMARALKLLRRSLSLSPDHQQASAALENTLIDGEDWLALDDLYREWLFHFEGADAVPLLLKRADLLENRLHRRDEARQLYEESSRYQKPDEESWRRLELIYSESGDYYALASLLDALVERMPDEVPTETLLKAAQVYRDELGLEERAAVYYYKVLEREPFNAVAFEGYKEHWRRKHNWVHLRDLILYQIEQAAGFDAGDTPFDERAFAEEFVELADICERRLGDIDGALDAWGRLAADYPSDPRPQKNIARIEKRARMWDNMVRVQEAELERTVDPRKRLDILKRLTQVYRDRQVNPERAIELYNEILALSPNDIQATRALTALYDRAGDYAQVVEMLREQYERSRSNTERVSLLRRMAELWHHELEMPDEAVWACEQILTHAPADKEALYRLQQILEEEGQYAALLDVLERELKQAGTPDAKGKILRRMARVAERDLGDEDRAAEIWQILGGLKPGSLEVTDKLVAVYEKAGRYEELGTMLSKAASSANTPMVRQVDYLLRLGQLAESHLDDPELARSSFESVLRSRPDHRGALEALVRLYRREDTWQPLCAILGKLQELAETEDDAFRIAWERSEILADQLDKPKEAAEVLEELSSGQASGRPEVASSLLELYERSAQHRKVIRQAEVMLLAAGSPPERRRLYETVSNTWMVHLGDKPAALAAYTRYVDEFSDDLDGLWTLADLQLQIEDFEAALGTLQRRLELATDVEMQTSTLEHMAQIAENRLHDGRQALDLLRRALAVDHFNDGIIEKIRKLAKQHKLWEELLRIYEERFGYLGQAGDALGRISVCMEASVVAETKYKDPVRAFEWARRGYFVAIENDREKGEAGDRLQQLAEDHKQWESLLSVIEKEISFYDKRGAIEAGQYDAVARYLAASEVAEEHLDDPERAVGFLQRAHRLRPTDSDLADKLEETAEKYKLWQPIIELYGGRLERAETGIGRFDACVSIARIYEEELGDAEQAFGWLQKAWRDLRESDQQLSDDAFDKMLGISERHGLWPQLGAHHLDRAKAALEKSDDSERLRALQDASTLFDERLHDPLGALRVLIAAIPHDPTGDALLPEARRLTEELDEGRDGNMPAIGALVMLSFLQRLAERAGTDIEKLQLLEERATLRDERLEDKAGAIAEWLRVLRLDRESDQAQVELERLAEEGDLWPVYLVLPAWELESTDSKEDKARLLKRLARIYEGPLERPEYALRSRLAAWLLEPTLPPRVGELGDDQQAIWRLAEQTGAYQTPPVPKDVLLTPVIETPEIADQAIWKRAGMDPRVLDDLPSSYAPKLELSAPTAVPTGLTEEVSLSDVSAQITDEESGAKPEPTDDEQTNLHSQIIDEDLDADIEEIEEIEEIEVEEIEEIEELPPAAEAQETVASGQAPPVDSVEDATRTNIHAPPVKAPPPPPRSIDAGLPSLPKLTRPVLPSRPRIASAWEEVALCYAEVDAADKPAQAEVALILARLWEEGAANLERAFQAHEQALLWVPEDPTALQSMADLAERHNVVDRLLGAYTRLLREATSPEVTVAMGMRIAQLHETRDELNDAASRYRGVLTVSPLHREALTSLCRIYETREEWAYYVEVFAELLEADAEELDENGLVSRTMELAELLAEKVNRKKDAISRLELLVRQYPERKEPHAALIELLVETKKWQHAIEAMKTASDAISDDDFRVDNLARVAEIYEARLGLPDRAIAALTEITDLRDDDQALAKLQRLYLDTSRFEPALPVIEKRLRLLDQQDEEDHEARISLLVAKARVLQEGLGDEGAATETLEELVLQAPDNDEALLGLSRLYRKVGRLDEGINLLRERWAGVDPKDQAERYVALTSALCKILDSEAHDPKGALEVAEAAIEAHPDKLQLLRLRARQARALHDLPLLAESLAVLSSLDDLLEAADLFRGPVGDGARAVRLYSRVLAESRKDADDPESPRRLASALEGLVKLRVQDGDIAGAMDFMDRQLAETQGPTIRAQLLTEMGRITFRSTGELDAASNRFDEALKEDPDYARAKLGKAEVLIEAGKGNEAEALLDDAVDALGLAPDHEEELVEALMLLAGVLDEDGRSGEAYRRLTAAARHAPENLEIRTAILRNRFKAQRFRDAITAADQVEQQLAEGIERTPKQMRLVSEIFVLAARAELELKQTDKALARYRRAAEIDSGNPAALEPLIALCQERGALYEAARHAATLARQTESDGLRGQRYMEAGMLFHDAAQALADGAEPTEDETEPDLRKASFETLRMGLSLVEGSSDLLLDRAQLEVAFRASAGHDPETALRCLDSLLLHTDIGPEHRHDLLLEGARIALAADKRLDDAEGYAALARELAPGSSAAVLAQARVLEATDRVDEIEALVEGYFEQLSGSAADDDDLAIRVQLLLRLAELQAARPEKAIEALERATELDANALTPGDRKTLASMYEAAGAEGTKVLRNHIELLKREPLHEPSLAALASHYAQIKDLDRAYALYRVLSLAAPEHKAARGFMEGHEQTNSGAGELELGHVVPDPPPNAGVSVALEQLWDGGAAILGEYLPRVDVPADARISPLGDNLLSRSWGELLKRLGQSKVALVDEEGVSLKDDDAPDGAADGGFFQIRCQQPPIIVAQPRAKLSEDEGEIRFALGRALYFTGPEAVFATGLRRTTLAQLLSAAMQAFHPRHSRRKHHQKGEDVVAKLSQELARKLPMRVSRQLSNVFREREAESFDSRAWRSWVVRSGNRVGLTLAGEIEAACRVIGADGFDVLRTKVRADDELRDLIAYACSDEFVRARKALGYEIKAL